MHIAAAVNKLLYIYYILFIYYPLTVYIIYINKVT